MSSSSKYWFKRRRYGWGWTPVAWQGWTSLAVALVLLVAAAFMILPVKPEQPTATEIWLFLGVVALDIGAVVALSIAKGPKPHWRWGKHISDKPDEDF